MDHPGDDQRGRDAPVAALDAQAVEEVGEAEIVEGLEAQALAADRARVLVGQRVEIDGGDVGLALRLLRRAGTEPLGPELGDDVLGCGLHIRPGVQQRRAVVEQGFDEFGDLLPLFARERVVGPQIEERPVANPVADALGEHQPVASDGLPGLVGVGLGGLDVHGAGVGEGFVANTRTLARLASRISIYNVSPGPTFGFSAPTPNI